MCSCDRLSSNIEVERSGVRVCDEGVGWGRENGDSGTILVTTSESSDEDCVASSCDTDKVT